MFKQPRVPEYYERDGMRGYVRALILFLKDFSNSVYTAIINQSKEIEKIKERLDRIEGK